MALFSITLLALQLAPVIPPLTLLPKPTTCARGEEGDDIVVCARTDGRYRLPLPAERDTARRDGPVRGEAPRASADGSAACGIFAGQRNCSKAEAARYGYGGGRDPLTVGTKLLHKILDPDADLGEPPAIPPRR